MPLMDFSTWRNQAMQNAGRDWNERDAQNQYEMYKIRQQGGTPVGKDVYGQIESGQRQGFSTGNPMYDYARQHGMSEDFARFDPATLQVWEKQKDASCPPNTPYRAYDGSGCVEKPIDSAGGEGWGGQGASGRGGGGGMGGGAGAGGGSMGGVPQFSYGQFTAPTAEQAAQDPGYQFALQQGQQALERSAAARGNLRTGNTLKDITNYAQGMAAQQYGDVFNRAAAVHGLNYQTAKDVFAPKYGAWQTMYGGDLAKWQSRYGGNLQRDLQREQNIYGLLTSPGPSYGGY